MRHFIVLVFLLVCTFVPVSLWAQDDFDTSRKFDITFSPHPDTSAGFRVDLYREDSSQILPFIADVRWDSVVSEGVSSRYWDFDFGLPALVPSFNRRIDVWIVLGFSYRLSDRMGNDSSLNGGLLATFKPWKVFIIRFDLRGYGGFNDADWNPTLGGGARKWLWSIGAGARF